MTASGAMAVTLGSALGAVLRQATSDAFAIAGAGFPWDTLTVNVLGSLIIGWLAALTVAECRLPLGENRRLFLMGGVCGGFTTFSVFSLETLALLQAGALPLAMANIAGTLIVCLGAVWVGFALGSRMNHGPRP
ncbi:fluoride efflux transporter CrcB [Aquisalimonas sp. 2447]|uniref:fluoride efflux transporter CrcB n=1 Tax=Aquisalimonas sp. 2447 TaxID=2740807 RepID=UPI0014327D87|nr:fluoride efflux transporter CrcB [Aquisalimonas sp. 2447]QIT55152.1 fluoride efflux transporter CrcB [Aquisalimonas sp. 2447]